MSMRLYIVWSPQWELGIPIIDDQHRGIISLINTLFYFMTKHRSEDVIIPLIRTIERYWLMHCMTEEELLKASGYPELTHHAEEHRAFSIQLSALMKRAIRTRGYTLVSDDLMFFLRKTQIEHLTEDDLSYVAHVKGFFERLSGTTLEAQDDPAIKTVIRIFSGLHIDWSAQWEFGIPIIDEQHRGLTSLTNSLFYFVAEQRSEDITLPLIKAIERYWLLHCITEEELLIQSGYPRAESHFNRHQDLKGHLSSFIINAAKNKHKAEVLDKLFYFLKQEQIVHIHKEDRQYVSHLKKHLFSRHGI